MQTLLKNSFRPLLFPLPAEWPECEDSPFFTTFPSSSTSSVPSNSEISKTKMMKKLVHMSTHVNTTKMPKLVQLEIMSTHYGFI